MSEFDDPEGVDDPLLDDEDDEDEDEEEVWMHSTVFSCKLASKQHPLQDDS